METPRHDRDLGAMNPAEVEHVLLTYRRRYRDVAAADPGLRIFLFRNHGAGAGPSLSHPHGQLVATAFATGALLREARRAAGYLRERGRCLLCDVTRFEEGEGRRIVAGGEAFAVFVPFAAEVPLETWFVPRRHRPDFGAADGGEIRELAGHLGRVLRVLRESFGDPAYNLVVRSWRRRGARHLHWFLRLRPRTATRAGFEISSGVTIHPSTPEADAEALRSALG